MSKDRPEDLFDIFEPWNQPDFRSELKEAASQRAEAGEVRPPWEPPPPPPPPPDPDVAVPPPDTLGTAATYTAEGALEPGMVVLEGPAENKKAKRVGPRVAGPAIPVELPDPVTEPGPFIRAAGIPAVTLILGRLEDHGHRSNIQDLLDLTAPSMRVLLWPKPGPLSRGADRNLATFELQVEPRDEDDDEDVGRVSTCYYFGSGRDDITEMDTVPLTALTEQWIVQRVLDFVKAVLDES